MVRMWTFLLLGVVCGSSLAQPPPVSSCQDLNTGGCQIFQKANPDLCKDPVFGQSNCKRFCGNCPTECYSCPNALLDPDDCNTTLVCGADKTCVTKHLHAVDGHHEYILTCESKQICTGTAYGFGSLIGKRHIDDVMELSDDERRLFQRDITIDCCSTDFCNLPGCHRDVVFLLDDSGSVGNTNFQHERDFVSQIVSNIGVGGRDAHVSAMAYSSTPQIEWYLNRYNTTQQVVQAIQSIPYVTGNTRTDLALTTVMQNVLGHQATGDRSDAHNVVVVLTDGRSTKPQLTLQAASQLQHYSRDVISIGIGAAYDPNELNAIATDGHHVFTAHNFTGLQQLVSQIVNTISLLQVPVLAAQRPTSACQDIFSGDCQVFQTARPDLCSTPLFADSSCRRFCGNCPTECYVCPNPVRNPQDCNTTAACDTDKICVTKHLHAADGHHEYIMACESKQICSSIASGFGKRHIDDVTELDELERMVYKKEVLLSCCHNDFCNMPEQTTSTPSTTTTIPKTTTTTLTTTPTTTATATATATETTTTHPKPTTITTTAQGTASSPTTTAKHSTTTETPTPSYNTQTTCHRDIVFMLADPAGVVTGDFLRMARDVVSYITIGPHEARVAMVLSNEHPQVQWYLGLYSTQQDVLTALRHLSFRNTGHASPHASPRLDLAIDTVMSHVLSDRHGARDDAENVVVLVTAAKSYNTIWTMQESIKLRHQTRHVVAVGMGPGFSLHELKLIATDSQHVFTTSPYSDLPHLAANIRSLICT